MTMKDPEKKDEQAQDTNSEATGQQSTDTQNTNWDKNQQIDEEGNEIGRDDIK